jgi:hypothetical protein
VFGAPLLADTLRRALSDFEYLQWVLVLLAVSSVLAAEQWLVPWKMFPRGGLLDRAAAFALSCAFSLLVVVALLRFAENRALAALFVVAIVAAIVFQFRQSGLSRLRRARAVPLPVGRLSAHHDGEVLSVRTPRKREAGAWPHFLFGAGFLAATWWLAARWSVSTGGGPGLLLLMVFALLGTAMVSLLIAGLTPVMTVQIHDGAIRAAPTFFGGAFGALTWHRRLRAPILLKRLRVTPSERQWLESALGARPSDPEPRVSLDLRARKDGVELRVENLGTGVVRLEDLETVRRASWTAEIDGRPADVYFSRSDRETEIPPGKAKIFRPRVHPWRESSDVRIRCGPNGPWVTI